MQGKRVARTRKGKDLCRAGKRGNVSFPQGNVPTLEAGRAGESKELCAGYSPCGSGL